MMSKRELFRLSIFFKTFLSLFLFFIILDFLSIHAFAQEGNNKVQDILLKNVASRSLSLQEEHTSTCTKVMVEVKAIAASKSEDKNTKIDPRISYLAEQLRKMPYQNYTLLVERSAKVPLMKKRIIPLTDNQTLTVRPIYANDKRVGVWLKWQDGKGMKILDTRMHFDCDQPMLTGLETNSERGLILAVSIKPNK